MINAKILIVFFVVYLICIEVLHVYFIMPFPGSQQQDTLEVAYFLHTTILLFRLIGWAAFCITTFFSFSKMSRSWRMGWGVAIILYGIVFYLFNYRFLADKMFYQPENVVFLKLTDNKVKLASLVLGVVINDEAKAYPIEVIGYHHQIRDSIGGVPAMITYCTVCRTGRVFSPMVNGKPENFRLVGMDHFNAMFEDSSTTSWWRQATGEAVAGPLTGSVLEEIASQQMSLQAWLNIYPNSKILQPDSVFNEKYTELKGYDDGSIDSHLEYRDSLSWKKKSWIVGLTIANHSRAYDWNDLVNFRIVNDTINRIPIVLVLEPDSVSFHAWKRDTLLFYNDNMEGYFRDYQTNSIWNFKGECSDGELVGRKLERIKAYQEFWHSWQTFQPNTTRFTFSKAE